MFIDQGYPIGKVLFYSKIPSSTWYKRNLPPKEDGRIHNKGRPVVGHTVNPNGVIILDSSIVVALKTLRASEFFENAGGYHKLTHYLERDYSFCVNHKKIYRLCDENNLLLPRKKKRKRQGKKICENRVVTGPNQLWQFDIKYGYIRGENRFFFLMAFIDVFSRKIVDYHIGLCCKASDIIFTLNNALEKVNVNPSDLVIRSDNGTQMTSHMFRLHIEALGLAHEFTPPSTPNLNAFIESFFSIIETELFQTHDFNSYSEAYATTVRFINHYHIKRIHGSLGNLTPEEFEKNLTTNNEMREKILGS